MIRNNFHLFFSPVSSLKLPDFVSAKFFAWLMITPAETRKTPGSWNIVNRSPMIIQPSTTVKTGTRLMKEKAWPVKGHYQGDKVVFP